MSRTLDREIRRHPDVAIAAPVLQARPSGAASRAAGSQATLTKMHFPGSRLHSELSVLILWVSFPSMRTRWLLPSSTATRIIPLLISTDTWKHRERERGNQQGGSRVPSRCAGWGAGSSALAGMRETEELSAGGRECPCCFRSQQLRGALLLPGAEAAGPSRQSPPRTRGSWFHHYDCPMPQFPHREKQQCCRPRGLAARLLWEYSTCPTRARVLDTGWEREPVRDFCSAKGCGGLSPLWLHCHTLGTVSTARVGTGLSTGLPLAGVGTGCGMAPLLSTAGPRRLSPREWGQLPPAASRWGTLLQPATEVPWLSLGRPRQAVPSQRGTRYPRSPERPSAFCLPPPAPVEPEPGWGLEGGSGQQGAGPRLPVLPCLWSKRRRLR